MPERNTGGGQRILEGERASENEANEIVAPLARDIADLFHQLAVAPHTVAREIGAKVEVSAEGRHSRHTAVRYTDHRTRLWVERTKSCEVFGDVGRQNDEVALDEPGSETRGRSGEHARSCREAHLAPDHDSSALPRVSGSRNAAMPMRLYAIVAKIAMARDSGIVAEM